MNKDKDSKNTLTVRERDMEAAIKNIDCQNQIQAAYQAAIKWQRRQIMGLSSGRFCM